MEKTTAEMGSLNHIRPLKTMPVNDSLKIGFGQDAAHAS
jgi:hypothetical protein